MGVLTSFFGNGLSWYNAQTYGPLMSAYLKKYSDVIVADKWEIRDRYREFYEIDTSQYMAYTNEDLQHEHRHANHSPHPDGEHLDSSWLNELDKFLSGQPNHLKEHGKYVNYDYEMLDKSFPSSEAAQSLIDSPFAKKI